MQFITGQKGKRGVANTELSVDVGFMGVGLVVHCWEKDKNGNRVITHSFYTADRAFLEHVKEAAERALAMLPTEPVRS